ncbi:MAG TPA: hypothetical protein VFN75_10595 [Pseudonocardiaceae bacterium]|nr:hypothetical protein [Pseudonocardiaceae bacterium]
MPRRVSGSQLADQVADLVAVLVVAQKVFPKLAEQARLELNELRGGLPTSERGEDCSRMSPPWYSDPTGEAVVNFRPPSDGECRPVEDLERIARFVAEVQQLTGTTRKMLNNAPSVTLAVVDGRKPTDGRSAEEHAQRKFVRALTDNRCLISQDHDDEDRYGPGQLRRGLCNRHRMQFGRWEDARRVWLAGVDAGERLVRWQAETFGTVAGASEAAEVDGGVYKPGLKEVA